MAAIFHPLLALIASATDRELAKYIQFLKEEKKILRARIPGVIHTRPEERERLIKFGKAIGRAIEELLTIVSVSTFYRWLRDEGQPKRKKNPKGGQRKPREIRELVIQIASVTVFGYTRIIGDLRKLGIKKISRQTVRNILKEGGFNGTESDLGLLGQLPGTPQGNTLGVRLLQRQDRDETWPAGHVCARLAVCFDAGSHCHRVNGAPDIRLGV